MRDLFPDYYRPTDGEFKALWGSAQFSLDANVLLNLFRYSHETARNLLDVFKWLGPRLWVSNQAALEYHRNFATALWQESEACRELLSKLPTGQSFTHARDLPILSEALIKEVRSVFAKIREELKGRQDRLLKSLHGDPMRDELATLLAGKVGPAFNPTEKAEAEKEGKARFDRKQPPGYADEKAKKDEPDRLYGDWFVWSQMLRHSKEKNTDLIFVTGERKEDWVLKAGDRTLGPRPELVGEFRTVVGKRFHLYDVATFLTYARDHVKADVKESSINEARALPPRPRGVLDLIAPDHLRSMVTPDFVTNSPLSRFVTQAENRAGVSSILLMQTKGSLGPLATSGGPLDDLMKSMQARGFGFGPDSGTDSPAPEVESAEPVDGDYEGGKDKGEK